ncbi:hypothetical protein EV646_11299 [Kribbella antiqua]|uniref:Uncharacterized protein n=1 Tax=Kribbella antiqua TaxID=2512217 RepID=A0A4R2IFL7_9ACTN|nr:hypothetical protein [Kribbella antiqua]TCO43523.1 hypothetical protein EV646_11299 [Kribbella antiqua]
MDFDEAADALYATSAADFIATRNELAKQLKADGDQLGSTRLKALRKPTVAAWVTNLVARSLQDELDDLLALGDEFRAATADLDGERLRELTPKRHQLIDKLAKDASKLAEKQGQKVSADVGQKLRETLDAALVDPAAGGAVREGRLSSALRHVGFGVVDENGEPANVTPLTDERRQKARERRQATAKVEEESAAAKRKREQAERAEEEREAAEKAQAKQAFEDAVAAAQEAEATVEDLDNQLDAAREALAEAQELVRRLGAELDEARRAARDAQKESREARKRYNRL